VCKTGRWSLKQPVRFSGGRLRCLLFSLALLAQPAICAAQAGRRHAVNPPDASRTPRITADSYSVRRGNVLTVSAANGVLANDSDPQGKPLSAILISSPQHGALFLNADGSFTYANDGGNAATDSFVYSASNTSGDANSARVSITIAADRAPVAANDSYTTAPGTTLTVSAPGVLSNDVDADGDSMTAVLVAGPAHGALTLNANGSFTYTPDSSNTTNDSFTYAADDGTLQSNAATVSITLDSAVRANADTYPATQNTPRTVDAPGVLANDLVNGSKIVSYGASAGTEQTTLGTSTATTAGGTVTLSSDGTLRFTPAPYFAGADTFKYKLSNTATSSTAVVLMMVFAAPTAKDDSYSASSGATTTISKPGVLSNDTVNSAGITGYGASTGTEQTSTGNATPTAKGGSVTLGADGGFTYTPPSNLSGSDTFKYTLGNFAGSSPATVTIDVSASPSAANDSYQAAANATYTATAAAGVLANDTLNGATILSYGAGAGTEQTSIGASTPTAAGNKISINADGSFVFVPTTNFAGTDSFKYKLSNSIGTSTGTVTIVVTSGPLAVNDSVQTGKNVTLAVSAPGLLANDTRNGGAIVSYGGSSGTEQTTLGNPAPTAQGGSVAVTADGAFNYTPPSNFTGSDTFRYVLSNSGGKSTGTVTIAVTQAPAAVNDSYVAVTSGAMSIVAPGVLTNDTLNGGKITSFGANGTEQSALGSAAPTAQGGTIALAGDGSFSYTPPPILNPSSALSDSFRYIVANNTGSSTATVTVLVSLQCPLISISPVSLPSGAPGSAYSATFSQTGGASPVTWTISAGALPPGLSFSSSGAFTGTPTLAGFYSITVKATDKNGCIGVATLPLTVSCPGIAVTPSTTAGPGVLPAGTGGVAYSSITFSQSGGTAPISWSVSAGALPPGMTLSSAGALSGTPATTGAFTFTVQATDANGCIGALPLSLAVNPKCPLITIAPTSLPSAAAGVVYPAVSFSQTGGVAPVTWAATALPPGMSFSTGGVLTGTPTGVGVFNITVTATDANGCTATLALPLGVGVTCPTIVIPAVNLATGISGTAYTAVTLTANGGVGTMTWTVAGGALPAGMSFSSTGALSGTPSQTGTFNFTVQATDSNGCFATRDLSLVVNSKCPAITIAPTSLPSVAAGVVYPAVSFSQTGGVAPVSWAATALPPGMSFSTGGVLTGTPTGVGVFNITVTATDANGCTATLALPLGVGVICPTIAIPTVNLATGISGTAYTAVTLIANGGVGTITWSLAAGTLPAGMSFSSAGALSGTPTQTGTFNFTVQATDSNGCFATRDLSLVVTSKCPAITVAPPPALPAGTAGTAYPAVSFSQTGGAAPVTWTSGALPAGMSLSTAGVLSGTPTQTGTFTVTVQVTDANGCTGTLSVPFAINCAPMALSPSNIPTAVSGSVYSGATFAQTGGVTPIVWDLAAGALPAGTTLSSAGALAGTPTQTGTFNITVRAKDSNGCPATLPVSLVVTSKCPTIAIGPSSLPSATLGVTYAAVNFTQTNGTAPVTWASVGTLPPGMSFTTAGVLFGTPTTAGVFNLTVTATDANSCTATLSLPFAVNATCPAITISPTSLAAGKVDTAYGSFTLTAAGGNGTMTWSVSGGNFPSGMSLSTAGVLSGTPTVAGTYGFAVKASDANGCFGTRDYTLTVNPKCAAISISALNPLPAGTAGTAYPALSFTQSGGTEPITWTSGALPSGMSFSTAGVLSGTPAATGSFNITVQATDANGCTATLARTLTVNCPTVVVSPISLSAGTVGTAYTAVTLSQTGGVAPITWSIASGTLPPGLSLTTAGVLSGTPTVAGTSNFTVRATDANGCSGTLPLTLNVLNACPVITVSAPSPFPQGALNVAYAAVSFTQTGGSGLVTWTSGALPAGMSFSTAGVLSGTPTSAGTYNLTVQATDANGCTGTLTIPFSVTCQAMTIAPTALVSGTYGVAYPSTTFAQVGGVGTIAWSLSAGSLPAGLTLSSSTGVLSGTPTQTGTFNFTVRATASNGCVASQPVTLAILCHAITVNPIPSSLTAGYTGVQHASVTFTQAGGTAPATFAVTAGALPTGMTLSSGGILSGTPTVAGTFNFTVTATDAVPCTGSRAYSMVINACSITVTSPSTTSATTGLTFLQTFTQSGGTAPVTFKAVTTLRSSMNNPAAIAIDPNNNIYVADTDNNSIKKFTVSTGLWTTLISGGLLRPEAVAVDNSNNRLYIADTGNSEIKYVSLTGGAATTILNAADGLNHPAGIAVVGSTLYIADTSNNAIKRASLSGGALTTIITSVIAPTGLAADGSNLLIADTGTHAIKRYNGTSTSTLVSSGLSSPTGVAVDASGNIYVADRGNNAIKRYNSSGGGATTLASVFSSPSGVALDDIARPHVADTGNDNVRVIGTSPGLTLSTTTGVLSGTPTLNGTFPMKVIVTDANSCEGSNASLYNLNVGCPLTITAPSTTTGKTGVAFSQAFSHSNQTGSVTYTTSSTLPAGLSLSTSGVLSGTPQVTVTNYPINVTVADSAGCSASVTYNLTISCGVGISPTNLAVNGSTGQSFSVDFDHSNAVLPVTYTATAGLPTGLSLNAATGQITGTLGQVVGGFSTGVRVTDAANCSSTAAVTFTIGCGLDIDGPSSDTAYIGESYSVDFDATQPYGSVTFSTTSTLPQGLSLNSSTGTISGTPAVITENFDIFPIVIRAQDGTGCITTHNFTLTVCVDLGPFLGVSCP
jgi:VCBS repeat-containing protein